MQIIKHRKTHPITVPIIIQNTISWNRTTASKSSKSAEKIEQLKTSEGEKVLFSTDIQHLEVLKSGIL